MTYLVTGAAGFLGRAIVDALLARGLQVVATDLTVSDAGADRTPTESGRLERVAYDVTNRTIPPQLERRFEAIIHAAALTGSADPERGATEKLVHVNVGGTANLLELARATQTSVFVYVSSSAVYRHALEGPLRESFADGGDTVYGASKFEAETLVTRECAHAGIRPTILRPCSLYGSGEVFRDSRPALSPVWHLASAAMGSRSVRLKRSTSRREWLSVRDAASAITKAAIAVDARTPRILNLGSGTLTELSAVAALVGVRVLEDGFAEATVDGGEDWAGYLDIAAIRDELEWAPSQSLEAGLGMYMGELTDATLNARQAQLWESGNGQPG